MKYRPLGLVILAALLLAGCSDGEEEGSGLRVVHLSPDAPAVDIYVDDELVEPGVEYLENTGYVPVPSGLVNLVITAAGDPEAVAIDGDMTLSPATEYTVMMANVAEDVEAIVLVDGNSPPSAGFFQVRVVHGAPSTGTVDVYVTAPDVPLAGRTPTVQDLAFGRASAYLEIPAGQVQVRVTMANTQDVILDSGAASASSGQIRTLIAADAVGGGGPLQWEVLADLN